MDMNNIKFEKLVFRRNSFRNCTMILDNWIRLEKYYEVFQYSHDYSDSGNRFKT
jgi:hypothetical protein